MSRRALFVLAALVLILVAPAALLAEEGNGNACDSSGTESRPEGKGPDCPDPEPEQQEAQQSSESTTGGETTTTATTEAASSNVEASQSEQGSEKGKGGPPEDGTRGNAKNKDPGGQDPPPTGNAPTLAAAHGEDHNRGFVCDADPGIGDGNPAHNPVCVQVAAAAPAPAPTLPRTGINALASAALGLQLVIGGFAASIVGRRRSSFAIEIDW